jgi:hypothetical protein
VTTPLFGKPPCDPGVSATVDQNVVLFNSSTTYATNQQWCGGGGGEIQRGKLALWLARPSPFDVICFITQDNGRVANSLKEQHWPLPFRWAQQGPFDRCACGPFWLDFFYFICSDA